MVVTLAFGPWLAHASEGQLLLALTAVFNGKLNGNLRRLLPAGDSSAEGAVPMAAAALAAAGPLPLHHPDALEAALAAGSIDAASAVLRRALHEAQPDEVPSVCSAR